MTSTQTHDWRTMTALNAVSTLAQIGQFGIAYVVLPVWLAGQGLDATQLGFFAASLWLGQMPGLALAPRLTARFGARPVIVAGLLCTVLALATIAWADGSGRLLGGMLAGFGLGLRWIGLEPWLYGIAPAEARGRMVGFHESLIALAPVVAPGLVGYVGLQGRAPFWIGGGFALGALVPLCFARDPAPRSRPSRTAPRHAAVQPPSSAAWHDGLFRQGVLIALLGGMMEAAVSGLFAPFAAGRGLTLEQTADLLVAFGLGGLLLQYATGWLADHRGLAFAGRTCAVGAAVAAVALVLPLGPLVLVVAVFLLGGFITAFLTLALVAGTANAAHGMAANVSRIAMLYTASAVAGPVIAGSLMHATHTDALMGLTAAASLVLAGGLAWAGRVHRPTAPA